MSAKMIEYRGLPAVLLENEAARSTITLYGAHVVEYIPAGMDDLLFVSEKSEFVPGKAIRGGVPVCLPWFGAPPEGKSGNHGIARISGWELLGADDCQACFALKADEFALRYTVTAAESLDMCLEITNVSGNAAYYSGALHTYFKVGDIMQVTVEGVDQTGYFNSLTGAGDIHSGVLKIDRETDVVFRSCGGNTIVDPSCGRKIVISKNGSGSTVIWNPWIDKSRRMADFGDDEYLRMLCVESANVPSIGDRRLLLPGQKSLLSQTVKAVKL